MAERDDCRNSYLLPLIFLQDANLHLNTQMPGFFQVQFTDDQTKVLASAVITALPIIVAYLSAAAAGRAWTLGGCAEVVSRGVG